MGRSLVFSFAIASCPPTGHRRGGGDHGRRRVVHGTGAQRVRRKTSRGY